MISRGQGRPIAYRLEDTTQVASVTTISGARQFNPKPLQIWYYRNGYEDGRLGLPQDPNAKLKAAAGAGTLAHLMVDNHIHGKTSLDGIKTDETDPKMLAQAQQGFQAYLDWQKIYGIEYLETETPMVSEKYRYGGTPDALGRTRDGQLTLCDWKTGSGVYGDHIIQLAAYSQLYAERGHKIEAWHLLRFGKDYGDFHHHSWPAEVIEMGWESFLHLRALYDLDKKLSKVAK